MELDWLWGGVIGLFIGYFGRIIFPPRSFFCETTCKTCGANTETNVEKRNPESGGSHIQADYQQEKKRRTSITHSFDKNLRTSMTNSEVKKLQFDEVLHVYEDGGYRHSVSSRHSPKREADENPWDLFRIKSPSIEHFDLQVSCGSIHDDVDKTAKSIFFEDFRRKLKHVHSDFEILQASIVDTESRYIYDNSLSELEEIIDSLDAQFDVNLVNQMQKFLQNVQDDEDIQEDEREVAKWITTSFLMGNNQAWASNSNGTDVNSEISSQPPAQRPMFQRFHSEDNFRKKGKENGFLTITTPNAVAPDPSGDSIPAEEVTIQVTGSDELDKEDKVVENSYDHYRIRRVDSKVLQSLELLGQWEFDIFDVEDLVGDMMLPLLGVTICKKLKDHPIQNYVEIPEKTIFDYLTSLNSKYHPEVTYHNCLHAADVMCSSYALVNSEKFSSFDYLQLVSLILAAAAHDVDHNGYNNAFHVNSGSDLALKYNDRSVLENHHCAVGWRLMTHPKHNVLKTIPREHRNLFRNIFISSILATDMTMHGEQLKTLGDIHKIEKFDDPAKQIKLLGHVLHSADISNVSKPFQYCNTWVNLVMQEFFNQGDKEKEMNLPISPLCDRNKTDIDSTEFGFIKFVVKPWFESLAVVLPRVCEPSLKYLALNFRHFKDRALAKQESRKSDDSRRDSKRRSMLFKSTDDMGAHRKSDSADLSGGSNSKRKLPGLHLRRTSNLSIELPDLEAIAEIMAEMPQQSDV